jgi:CubicO group peptidase (beta-lactamase class C family)
MRRALIAALLLTVSAPSLSQEAVSPPPASVESLAPTLDTRFRQFMEERHVPGLVWGIVQDGRLVHLSTMGVQDLEQRRPVTGDSLFRIASMSKVFTALAILKLRDDARLSLDALAETYVPELRGWRYPTSDSPRIRVRDLLAHTGGLVTDNPWGDRQQDLPEEDFTRMLAEGVPMSRAPGTAFEYSNFGYALLGRIVSNVSGRPYADYIEQEIMRPLGMISTRFDIARSPIERRAIGYRWENETHVREPDLAHGTFGAMGGIETSANDYARWLAFLASAWPARDGPEVGPVRRATVRELAQGLNFARTSERPGLDGAPTCRFAVAYGMGLSAAQDCDLGFVLSHSGGYPGYGSYMMVLPESGTGLFAFANRTYAAPIPTLTQTALELRRAGLVHRRDEPVTPALAAAYAGAGAAWRAGNLTPVEGRLAMNFLPDRSAENWARELARLNGEVGACATDAPITATGAMSGTFEWRCERGSLQGYLLLAPTNPPTIQELRLRVAS